MPHKTMQGRLTSCLFGKFLRPTFFLLNVIDYHDLIVGPLITGLCRKAVSEAV